MMSFIKKSDSTFIYVGFILTFISSFGQLFLISLFHDQIITFYDISSKQWANIYTFSALTAALAMLLLSRFVERIDFHLLCIYSIIGLMISCCVIAISDSIYFLTSFLIGIRFFGYGMMISLFINLLAHYKVNKKGKLIAFGLLGLSFGEALFPILIVQLLDHFDWVTIWLFAAIISGLSVIIINRLLLKIQLHFLLEKKTNVFSNKNHRSWIKDFLLIIPFIVIPGISSTLIFFNMILIIKTNNWSLSSFVSLFTLLSLSTVVTNIGIGKLIDSTPARALIPWVMVPSIISLSLLSAGQSFTYAIISMLCIGIMYGLSGCVNSLFIIEHFKTYNISKIKLFSSAIAIIFSALTPYTSGLLLQLDISINEQLSGLASIIVIICIYSFCLMNYFKKTALGKK